MVWFFCKPSFWSILNLASLIVPNIRGINEISKPRNGCNPWAHKVNTLKLMEQHKMKLYLPLNQTPYQT